jgi:hypothetical protein
MLQRFSLSSNLPRPRCPNELFNIFLFVVILDSVGLGLPAQ